MGTDIMGWAEVQTPELGRWFGVVYVRSLVERNYSLFGCLFGYRQQCDAEPLAPNRGIPDSMSREVRRDLERVIPGATWVSWSELADVVTSGTSSDRDGQSEHEALRQTIGESMTPGWNTLFQFMRILAERYGPDQVRLVVWFDS
ncbi:MAG: hypothetical protein ACREP9_14050 [Candidatus Dormibacteraceae bacterium]